MTVSCGDCWAASLIGERACPRHSTPEERADWQRRINESALREHPLLKLVKRG